MAEAAQLDERLEAVRIDDVSQTLVDVARIDAAALGDRANDIVTDLVARRDGDRYWCDSTYRWKGSQLKG